MPPLKDFALEGKENFKEIPCNFNQEGPLEQCLWCIESSEERYYLSLQEDDERREVRACLSQELGASILARFWGDDFHASKKGKAVPDRRKHRKAELKSAEVQAG